MLQGQFLDLIGKYSNDDTFNARCWKEIATNYNSKSRYYHNLRHLENMLQELEIVKQEIQQMDNVLFSIYYHDIIYKPTKSDNEYQSALFFKKRITQTDFEEIEYCFRQIEATKTHEKSEDKDTNILLDIDLSILGQRQDIYEEYCQQIRQEYRIYPNFLYRKGRSKVLRKMLASSSIYNTPIFQEKYEKQARENLEEELDGLTNSSKE